MRQKRVRLWSLPSMQQTKALLLIAACFAGGALLGCLFSARLQGEGSAALTRYLDRYLTLMGQDAAARPSWLGLSWSVCRGAVLLTLLRFTALGVLLIPLGMGAKGFLVSFAVSAFVRSYRWRGLAAAALLFGIPEGIQLAVLLLLAVRGWTASAQLGRQEPRGGERESFFLYVGCFLLLGVSVALQKLLAGPLARALGLILADLL